ncbi:uncharacterized protein M6B38_281285 [Iris pallida]|uniref:J domain-containing protein n=1 Tax=Iris pallida TaxID=29817 RepID=A0AAX6I2H2_IRIPA|nr:uncharacterized protein M6B38_281285 [Iris pallida]
MARKGNQHKNGLDRKSTTGKQANSESVDVSLSEGKEYIHARGENTVDRELPDGENICRSSTTSGQSATGMNHVGVGKRNKKRSGGVPLMEKLDDGSPRPAQATEVLKDVGDDVGKGPLSDASESRRYDGRFCASNDNLSHSVSRVFSLETMSGHIQSSLAAADQNLRVLAVDVLNAASGWVERQKPRLSTFTAYIRKAQDYIFVQMRHVYPIIQTWTLHVGKLILLLSVVWMDCNIRGFTSLVRLGTTSFFAIFWCSILSIIAMIGMTKVFIIMMIAALVAAFIGLALGFLVIAIFSTVILWLYGSFWTTALIVLIGGSTLALRHDRAALLITTLYSVHCARSYLGWLGLLLALNLSFISSDILLYFLKNLDERRSGYPPEQERETQDQSECSHSSAAENDFGSRGSGVPSTSGYETELTSEDEVVRLLNCGDHYSALGFARFENIDVSLLKREYRKKAMMVHPDKNMGNEKAAEAFKKLQNAYEVLLDTLKRKTYDDELRREELLNYFRRFQTASQKKGMNNFSAGSTQFEAEAEGPCGESRRIACKKCGQFHMWMLTERLKSRARWCQDCNDFHQAKDGDGWLEQSFQPFFFGLLNKVEAPRAYVCAESRIYDATAWFICQGMRCPANTHKPSFHVNTGLSSKQHSSSSKGTSSTHRSGGGGGMPSANGDEPMTEEELFEWLQNAMQSGCFEASGGGTSNGSPSSKSGSTSKSSSAKRRRKGKKQW